MTKRTHTRVSRAAALVMACALGVSLSACGRSDPVQEEIDRVSIGLDAISTSGGTPLPSVEQRRRVYEWSINRLTGRASPRNAVESDIADTERELKAPWTGQAATTIADPAPANPPAVDAKNAGQAAAANLLLARGHSGLAEISAQEAARLEARSLGMIPPIRIALDQWLAQNAAADAFASYNPAPEIARIEAQIADRQKQADEQRAGKDRQLAIVRGLEQQAEQLNTQARTIREQEATLRATGSGQSEVRRLDILTEATGLRRDADKIEKQAADLLAQVGVEQPKADEMQARIDEYTMQAQLLRDERENLRKRGQDSAAAAERARQEARSAAERLAAGVTELETARKEADAPTEEAIRGYTQAVAAARKAQQNGPRDSQSQAAISVGSFQHLLGELRGSYGYGQQTVAGILTAVAEARPALPDAASFATKATEYANLAKASLDASKTAYQEAKASYAKGGAQALADAMTSIAGEPAAAPMEDGNTPAETPADGAAAVEPAAETPAAAAPAGDLAAAEAEVRAAIDRMIAASKANEPDALKGMIMLSDAAARPTLDALIDASAGPAALNATAVTTYSKSLKELVEQSQVPSVRSSPLLGSLLQQADQLNLLPADLGSLTGADAVVMMESPTRATVTIPAGDGDIAEPQALVFVKDAETWKIDADSMLAEVGGAQGLAMMAPMLGPIKAMGGAFTMVNDKLKAGEYADADRMLIDLNKELMAAMAKAGGLGAPPPAPPPPPPPPALPPPTTPGGG